MPPSLLYRARAGRSQGAQLRLRMPSATPAPDVGPCTPKHMPGTAGKGGAGVDLHPPGRVPWARLPRLKEPLENWLGLGAHIFPAAVARGRGTHVREEAQSVP